MGMKKYSVREGFYCYDANINLDEEKVCAWTVNPGSTTKTPKIGGISKLICVPWYSYLSNLGDISAILLCMYLPLEIEHLLPSVRYVAS